MNKMWKAILRGWSPKFPEEMVTGQPALDDYLRQLDAQLWGSAKVRLVELSEIRDHLVESHAALVRQGQSPSHAAEVAVSQAGSFEDIVHNQHQTMLNRFLRFFWMGVAMAVFASLNFSLMSKYHESRISEIMSDYPEMVVKRHWLVYAFLAFTVWVIGFVLLAWHFSFQTPSTLLGSRPPTGSSFPLRRKFPKWAVFFFWLPLVSNLVHLAITSKPFYHSWTLLFLSVPPAFLILYLEKGQSFGANDHGFWIRHWPFPPRQFTWENIERFGPVDTEWPFRNAKPMLRKYYLDYRGSAFLRRFRRLNFLPGTTTNVDQLFLLLEEKTGRPPVPLSQVNK